MVVRREKMKVLIEFETEKPLEIQLEKAKDFLLKNRKSNPGQQQINNNSNNNSDKNIICYKCGVNLYDKYDDDTVKKINNFCKIKYKTDNSGKYNIFCKDCQKILGGGE